MKKYILFALLGLSAITNVSETSASQAAAPQPYVSNIRKSLGILFNPLSNLLLMSGLGLSALYAATRHIKNGDNRIRTSEIDILKATIQGVALSYYNPHNELGNNPSGNISNNRQNAPMNASSQALQKMDPSLKEMDSQNIRDTIKQMQHIETKYRVFLQSSPYIAKNMNILRAGIKEFNENLHIHETNRMWSDAPKMIDAIEVLRVASEQQEAQFKKATTRNALSFVGVTFLASLFSSYIYFMQEKV